MIRLKILLFVTGLTLVGCASKKQIYADRLIDSRNRHVYVNDSLDFSIWYFDVISQKARQTDSIDFKKSNVPNVFQKHLKSTVKRPSEILYQAHRSSMSDEDILGVLYKNPKTLSDFSNKILKKLAAFVLKDSLKFQPYQSMAGYWLNMPNQRDEKNYVTPFFQNRPFNTVTYKAQLDKKLYKFHEFHVLFNKNTALRFVWIADIDHTIKGTKLDWEKIDERNHYLEFFHLTDSAKFHLKEIVPNNPYQLAQDAFKEYGYLGAVNTLLDFENTVETKGTEAQKSQYLQALMTFQSFMGDNKAALVSHDKVMNFKFNLVNDNYFEGSEAHDAAQYILQKAGNQQVVMFNEAHSCGQQRAFMRDILRGLYEKGFRHFALEALNAADSINERGYPLRLKSGIYTNEPTFGQMLREAQSQGFQLWGYENDLTCPGTDCANFREARQTENLKKILDKDPNAKIVVWAGHGHIYENDEVGWKKMAFRFKKLTGIDPLTIEQTQMRALSTLDKSPSTWKTALKKWQFKKPIIVTAKDTVFVAPALVGKVDMQVFFPPTEYPNDYPHWMGNSETTSYDLNLHQDHFKDKLLMIFIEKEYNNVVDKAVPVMNIPLSKLGIFKLFLKPDKYVAVIRDGINWEYLYKEFEIQANIESEINALTMGELKKAYLLAIFNDDQKVRKDFEDVSKLGQESKEYQERGTAIVKMDSINMLKIEKYLAQYPYPSKAIYGEIPAYTPWTVIHHSGSLDIKQRYFPLIYKAWKNKDIKDNSFYLYLTRAYRFKFDKAFRRESGMSNLDEINQLIKELGFIVKE